MPFSSSGHCSSLSSVLMANECTLTAEGSLDYEPLLDVILDICNPAGGECCHNLSARIVEDSILEGNETFLVQMSSTDSQVIITQGKTVISITNDDCKSIRAQPVQ